MRRDAARVMRGATTGGAVEATAMVSERLCPGTLANICASFSLLGATRGPRVRSGDLEMMPARRLAARVVRGVIVGVTCEAGAP